MTLSELLSGVSYTANGDFNTVTIGKPETDSRKIEPGDVFFALSGLGSDGHNYIRQAVENGAVAVVAEHDCNSFGAHLVLTESSRKAIAIASANFFGHPAEALKLIGVTGTNGKTTVTHIIKQILDLKGIKTGLIGTNHYLIGKEELPSTGTTPEALELHGIFKAMAEAGCEYVIMETSSHALSLDRLAGLTFEVGVFTNLTEDHLNYHKDMDDYAAAKATLFEQSKIAVINGDDPYSRMMKKNASKVYTYGIEKNADMMAFHVDFSERGVSFDWRFGTSVVHMRMAIPGKFSVYNALAGIGASVAIGLNDEDIQKGLLLVRGVKGRAEVVPSNTDYTIMIDYAHTPDGIENILNAVRGFVKGRIILVFGCGGDRETAKRPKMGNIAGRLSDIAIVTSDNPRTEDPASIVRQITEGMKGMEDRYVAIVDRTEAIRYALSIAKAGDVVLLAGKGHETYQDVGGTKKHYDEREIIKELLSDPNKK